MESEKYEIIESVAGFVEGDVLTVTARYGHWHTNDMELKLNPALPKSKRVVVSEESTGFSERDIVDETARIGDWHEEALKFDAGAEPLEREVKSPGPARVTMDELRRIAEPVGETAR